jgi:hypothetical protein
LRGHQTTFPNSSKEPFAGLCGANHLSAFERLRSDKQGSESGAEGQSSDGEKKISAALEY